MLRIDRVDSLQANPSGESVWYTDKKGSYRRATTSSRPTTICYEDICTLSSIVRSFYVPVE